MSRKLTPIRCTPQYYHKIWGGGHLAPTGGDKQIGEAWLLSALIGQETPTEGPDYEGASLDALVARADRADECRRLALCHRAW